MRRPPALTVVLWAAALCPHGCTFRVPLVRSSVTDRALVQERTASREAVLEVTEGMDSLVVSLDARLDAGAAEWSLVAPDGTVRWRSALRSGGTAEQRLSLPVEPGAWTVRRQWHGFSGCQDFAVVATGPGVLEVQVRVR